MWVYLVVHEENARQYDIFEYEKEILNQPRKRRR
jgi:predicted RNA-binding protein